MYTEQDLIAIKSQKNKRWLVLGIPCTVLLIGLIISLIVRIEPLTVALTILMGALLIGGYDLFIKPLRLYQLFLHNVLHGLTREVDCFYQSITTDAEMVDGVDCHTIYVTDHDDEGKPFERIFYYDALKPLPTLTPGQKVHVVFHDRAVVSITPV